MTTAGGDDAGAARMLARGATKRCARCGRGGLFRGWFRMVEDCPGCGLHFEREPGYWTGALAVNMILVGGLFLVVLVAGLALTIPDVPVVALLAVTLPVVLVGPVVAYPWSKTLWVALDRGFLQRLDAHERPDEQYRR